MSNDDTLQQIKEALAAATPGPWSYTKGYCSEVYAIEEPRSDNWVCQLWYKDEENMSNYQNNAHLIANSPTWLQWAIQRIEALERQNQDLNGYLEAAHKRWG
ncbi:hypothetical protein ACFSL6_08820 [Paenibacillus thailandensis]|uniref:Uncharacterized protein n=1 Tax=Paenibacillus thailandensis TaxID=393250 RepID=A0ABW5QTS0_9BACL